MKRCKLCKELKVREVNGLAVSKFCSACKKIKDEEKKAKKKLTKTYQKARYKTLHRKAWKLISERIRRTGAVNGYNECYTCRKMFPWKECHCSHYIHGKLDFDERNLKNCCNYCNTYLSGNLGEYTLHLIEDYGLEWIKELKADKNKVYTIEELETIIEYEKEKLKILDLWE